MRFLNRFENWNMNEKVTMNQYEDIQNDILDKISSDGMDSLSRLERELLRSISKGDSDYIESYNQRLNEYREVIESDIRIDYPDLTMSDKELIEFNAESLWYFIEEIDIDHFATIYNYPVDIADFTWDTLPKSVIKDFIDYTLILKN